MRIRNDSGFSLGELITVMGILTVMATIAVPSFLSWRNKSMLSRTSRDVYSSFQKAKLEAVRRNENCAVTFRANDYVIYIDSNQNFGLDTGEDIINTVNWTDYRGSRLDNSEGGGDGLTFANPNDTLVFAPDGLPRNSTGGLASGTVFLRNKSGTRQNTVTISTAGNIQINQTG